MMFPYTYPSSLNDLYFGYVNMIEFACFLFVRTRISIKYLPKFITILNLVFLFYINSYMYAASIEIFLVLMSTSILVFSFFLLEFEQPAIVDWFPFDVFTPRMQNPRMGYQLVLDDTTFGTGFNLWHMFMPVRSREAFTFYEQARFDSLAEHQRYGLDYSVRPVV